MPQRDEFDDQKRSDVPKGGERHEGTQREGGGGGMNDRDRKNREREDGKPKQS